MQNQEETTTIETTTTTNVTAATAAPAKVDLSKLPLNERRAHKLRNRAATFGQDEAVLERWVKREKDGEVTAISAKIDEARALLEEAADMYDALPDYITSARTRNAGASFKVGDLVESRAGKVRENGNLVSDPMSMEVIEIRGTHFVTKGQRDGETVTLLCRNVQLVGTEA